MTDWEAILAEHGRLVWQKAWRLLGNHADTSDCFQDVFVSAMECAKRQEVRNWPALLRTLTNARALDRLRSRIRRRDHFDEPADIGTLASEERSPAQRAESNELTDHLREALSQLPAQQSEAFCLRFFEGMSYAEIAVELHITSNAAGVLIHRARGKLQSLLVNDASSYDARFRGLHFDSTSVVPPHSEARPDIIPL